MAEAEKSRIDTQDGYIFALDIGTRTVVGIIGEYIDEKFHLTDYISVPHTKRAMVDGQVEDIKQVAKIVAQVKKALEERNNIQLSRVSIAAAGRALRTIQVSMDFDITEKEYITEDMVKSMEIEAIQKAQSELDVSVPKGAAFYCVGHSVINYMLDDYKMISLEGHKGETAQVNLIAAFLPSIVVEGLYTVMDMNGLEVISLTLEPIAAMNVIVPPEIRLINIALVDIGAGTSDIAVAKDGAVYAYAMATTAGDEITEEIIRSYLVDFNTAEELKQNCSESDEELGFSDILGIPHKLKASEIYHKVVPAVDVLAETICNAITEVNNGSPAAVFLVGGGSLIEGLPALVAKKLGLDEARVAIGGGDFLKNVDENGAKLGAEFVTPVGIAVTTALEQGYDFSVITVNDKKVRAFDTKQLTVFEALNLAGYKSADIMGRSGRNLTYTMNGKRIVKKGGGFTASEVYVNDKTSSVISTISQGDRIRFVPASSGENAHATLGEAINYGRFASGTVEFGGVKHQIGLRAIVNGVPQEKDYEIQPLDNIETSGIVTLGDLLQSLDIELDGLEYLINGQAADESYVLSDGDMISYNDGIAKEEAPEPVPAPAKEEPAKEEPVLPVTHSEGTPDFSVFEQAEEEETKEIPPQQSTPVAVANEFKVELNGLSVTLGEGSHMLLDLLNFIDIDPTAPNTELILEINGAPANFSSPINAGDKTVIRLQPRK